jgi:hypothetical protein
MDDEFLIRLDMAFFYVKKAVFFILIILALGLIKKVFL